MRRPGSHSCSRLALALSATALALGTTACGGSGSKPSGVTSHTTAAHTTTAPTTPPVRGTLRGQNHAPRINKAWSYSVTVTSASGRPLSGTVDIEFVFGDRWSGGTRRRRTR
jgi:hypothetical protein